MKIKRSILISLFLLTFYLTGVYATELVSSIGDYIQDSNIQEPTIDFYNYDLGFYFEGQKTYEKGDFTLYTWTGDNLTQTRSDLLIDGLYENPNSTSGLKHHIKEQININSNRIWYYEDRISEDSSETLSMGAHSGAVSYKVSTGYIPLKYIYDRNGTLVDSKYTGKIALFNEEYSVKDFANNTLFLENSNNTAQLQDGEDIKISGQTKKNWRLSLETINNCADDPLCNISSYTGMNSSNSALLKSISISYQHNLFFNDSLEKDESLFFPKTFKLTFKGFLKNNYRESDCSGAGQGDITLGIGTKPYQLILSFTGSDRNRYNNVRLDEGPFQQNNLFIINGNIYNFQNYELKENGLGSDDDTYDITLNSQINGTAVDVIGLQRYCNNKGRASQSDPTYTHLNCADIDIGYIRIRKLALVKALREDNSPPITTSDYGNDSELMIDAGNVFVKKNVFNVSNGATLDIIFDETDNSIFFSTDISPSISTGNIDFADPYLYVNANMIGTLDDFDVKSYILKFRAYNEENLLVDPNHQGYNVMKDMNQDGDDDDTLMIIEMGDENAVIDFSDRDYNSNTDNHYSSSIFLDYDLDLIEDSDEIRLHSPIDTMLIAPYGGDNFTLRWGPDGKLNSIALCHPQDHLDATYFLGTTENSITSTTTTTTTSTTNPTTTAPPTTTTAPSTTIQVTTTIHNTTTTTTTTSMQTTTTTTTTSTTTTINSLLEINNLRVISVGANSATIAWSTGIACKGLVDYGAMMSYGINKTEPEFRLDHAALLTNLTPGTVYHYKTSCSTSNGSSVSSADDLFKTSSIVAKKSDFLANKTTEVDASEANTVIDFVTNKTIYNATINISYSTNSQDNATISVPSIGRFIKIETNEDLRKSIKLILLKIYYTDEEVSYNKLNESSLGIYWFSGSEWVRLNTSMDWIRNTGVNTEQNYVWAYVKHLSDYTVGGQTVTSCSLTGDYPQCRQATLTEVISSINNWAVGQATLQEVVALINAWATQ